MSLECPWLSILSLTATLSISGISLIIEDLCSLHDKYVVLFFKLLPEVLFEASIVHTWNIIILVFIDIYDDVLHLLREELFDLVGHLRVVALGRLDGQLELLLAEHNLGLGRINSGILQ